MKTYFPDAGGGCAPGDKRVKVFLPPFLFFIITPWEIILSSLSGNKDGETLRDGEQRGVIEFEISGACGAAVVTLS